MPKFNFFLNPDIDLTKVVSSMELDSGQEVASLETDRFNLSVRVCGYVTVHFNPDPKGEPGDGDTYTSPSNFPDDLMKLVRGNKLYDSPNVDVSENNWFELFVDYDGKFYNSDVVDVEGHTPKDLFNLFLDAMQQVEREAAGEDPVVIAPEKLYIVTVNDVYEYQEFKHNPIVCLTKDDASAKLQKLLSSGQECYEGQYDGIESTPDSFSLFPKGRWATSHYDARISEVTVPGIRKN